MNKSRRVVSESARTFARDGWLVMVVDLLGCGDSSGEFGEARWEHWLEDVVFAFRWLDARAGRTPALWGLRGGALVATQAIERLEVQPHLLFWQPVLSGKLLLNQFLRLRSVGDMLGEHETTTSTKVLREQLAKGEALEIAGYELGPALALPLEMAVLDLPARYSGNVMWCDVDSSSSNPGLAPTSLARVESWREREIDVEATAVRGAPFWQTLEIAQCPDLIKTSQTLLARLAK